MYVEPKKRLGQHFLKDLSIAQRIAELLTGHGAYKQVLEIGPGTGVLTQFLLKNTAFETYVIEIDRESVDYLKLNFPALNGRILAADFLNIRPDLLPTNIVFGGADMMDAWVCLSTTGQLAKCRWPRPGLRLAHYA